MIMPKARAPENGCLAMHVAGAAGSGLQVGPFTTQELACHAQQILEDSPLYKHSARY